MSIKFSFCNDCDLMTRAAFEEVHEFFDSLRLPAGDSFWLFDPSGGDMGLFTHDINHHGPQHNWLLDQINAGVLDIVHSAGSYGERFNGGFKPDRKQIGLALEYLAKNARVPQIWTNHGDVNNTQNIGGASPLAYQKGDLPGDETYCLDLLHDFGIKYFWLDRLVSRNASSPFRVTSVEQCRDGSEIMTFKRYLSPLVDWSPNAQNFDLQLVEDDLLKFVANSQDIVLFTHWGCHHQEKYAHEPKGHALTDVSRHAIECFAKKIATLDIEVTRLMDLLEFNRAKPIEAEIQRIGEVVVRPDKDKQDCFYFNQYGKHGLSYFRQRINGMAVSGHRALDAGCGVGQWTFALNEHFDQVYGVEINESAHTYLDQIQEGLQDTSAPEFIRGSIEELPFQDNYFDFICCYGVIFCTKIKKSLLEFARILAPGGRAYICLNGDGWYEYLVDVRFGDKSNDFLEPFATPLWNALVSRVGGALDFHHLCLKNLSRMNDNEFWEDPKQIRKKFVQIFAPKSDDLAVMLNEYSDRVIQLLGILTQRYIRSLDSDSVIQPEAGIADRLARIVLRYFSSDKKEIYHSLDGVGAQNRAVLPHEFSAMLDSVGLCMGAYGADGELCKDKNVSPIYQGEYNGHYSVWECYANKV